jgi:hypothetical protein
VASVLDANGTVVFQSGEALAPRAEREQVLWSLACSHEACLVCAHPFFRGGLEHFSRHDSWPVDWFGL